MPIRFVGNDAAIMKNKPTLLRRLVAKLAAWFCPNVMVSDPRWSRALFQTGNWIVTDSTVHSPRGEQECFLHLENQSGLWRWLDKHVVNHVAEAAVAGNNAADGRIHEQPAIATKPQHLVGVVRRGVVNCLDWAMRVFHCASVVFMDGGSQMPTNRIGMENSRSFRTIHTQSPPNAAQNLEIHQFRGFAGSMFRIPAPHRPTVPHPTAPASFRDPIPNFVISSIPAHRISLVHCRRFPDTRVICSRERPQQKARPLKT